MTIPAARWLEQFAERLGVEAPSDDEANDLLALAGSAAHASERTAAPIACWLLGKAGLNPAEGRARAAELAAELAERER